MDGNYEREFGQIETMLKNHTILLGEIKTSLDKNSEVNARQDVDINCIAESSRSVQCELTEHKQNHRVWIGYTLTAVAIIATIFATIGEKISKRF